VAEPPPFSTIPRHGPGRYIATGERHIAWDGVPLPGLHKNGTEIPLIISFGEFTREGKRVFTAVAVFALGLGLSLSAFSQETSSGMDQPSDKKAGNAKLKHLKGTIGQDGKSFTSDKDKKTWSIMNPEAVKGHEGHHVRLEAHVYPDKEAVHVEDIGG
jgi:hypothetical protein